jgi:uncharacterized protein with HEPN domain
MRRTALQYLDDILEAIGNIEEDTTGITYEEFVADRRRRDAVIRNFQVIGEAIKNLPDDLKEGYPETDTEKDRRVSGCPHSRLFWDNGYNPLGQRHE